MTTNDLIEGFPEDTSDNLFFDLSSGTRVSECGLALTAKREGMTVTSC